MRMWGQVDGTTRADEDAGPLGPLRAPRYGGSDWWRDCGTSEEAIERHERRGQAPCKICLEGRRRRAQEARERETGVPIVLEALLRELNALNRTQPAGARAYRQSDAPCGTPAAARRHRRLGDSCVTCGIKDGRSATAPRIRETTTGS